MASVVGLSCAMSTPGASAHGGDPTLVHACVNKGSGEIKIVGPSASCKPHETAVDWPAAATASGVSKTLTEISLVSVLPGFGNATSTEVSRFLWEPDRYDPAAAEIFLEVVGALTIGDADDAVTFRLREVATDAVIAGSSLTITGPGTSTASGVRRRTGNLVLAFPAASVEIALVAELTPGAAFSLQRSAVLVQQ